MLVGIGGGVSVGIGGRMLPRTTQVSSISISARCASVGIRGGLMQVLYLISTESVVLLGLGGDVSIGVGTKVLLKLILVRD